MKNQKFVILLVISLMLWAGAAKAQKGNYIDFWAGPQLVTLNNYNDYNPTIVDNLVNRVTTYRGEAGMDYVHNFSPMYGIQTGFYFSQQGQRYSGKIESDYDNPTKLNDTANFASHVFINYFKIPLYFRFNSEMDEDERMNLSMFMGMEAGILQGVQEAYSIVYANPYYENRASGGDLNKMYKTVDMQLAAGLQLNERITHVFGAFVGMRFSRSLGNIEKLNYPYTSADPVWLRFPISVPKDSPPDLTVRYPTKNTSIGVYIGVSFYVGGNKED
jgi:hypothetical protein